MNTGIGDAVDLGWKLAAAVKGWGGEALLDTYEVERLAIAHRNRDAAGQHAEVRAQITNLLLEAETNGKLHTEDGRVELGRKIAELGNAENESWGIEHGYCYRSSVIISDAEEPVLHPLRAVPTTVPGCRIPSLHLADGRALLDLLGPNFTLVSVGDADAGKFEAAANAAGLPANIVRLEREPILDLLRYSLVIVRPDQHVAWCGVEAPDDWSVVLATVTGRDLATADREIAV